MNVLFGIPGVSKIVENFVRATFFHQFVGAETVDGALPLLAFLRAENKGVLFKTPLKSMRRRWRVRQHVHKRIVKEMTRSIDISADYEDGRDLLQGGYTGRRRTCIAVKLTALLPNAPILDQPVNILHTYSSTA